MASKFCSTIGAAAVFLSLSTSLAQADNLTLNITDTGFDPSPAGAEIPYVVRVNNGGNVRSPADSIVLTIPANTTYVGVTGGLTDCGPEPELEGPAELTCVVPSLAPRGMVSAEVLLRPSRAETVRFTGRLVDEAIQVTQSTTITEGADLALTMTGPLEVAAGDFVTLNATITNRGPYTSNGGTFSMSLPSGLTPEAMILPENCSISGTQISCELPDPLAVGDSLVMDFSAQVVTDNDSAIAVAASITPLAPLDPNLSNDSTSTSFFILAGTDVSLRKTRNTVGLVFIGDTITFTLVPRHAGRAPLDAEISDLVPANYTVTGVSAAGTGWECPAPEGNLVACSYTSLEPDAANYNAPITITATVDSESGATAVTNTAEISSTTDAIAANNTASDTGADIAVPAFDLIARKSGPLHGLVAVDKSYEWRLWTDNIGNKPFVGTMRFVEHLPAGLRADYITLPAGTGWACDFTPPVEGPANIVCETDDYVTEALPVAGTTPPLVIGTTVLVEGELGNGLTVDFSDQEYDDRDLPNNTITSWVGSGEDDHIADISVLKTLNSSASVVSGTPVSFTIEVVNSGRATAEDVVVLDALQDLYFTDLTTTGTTIDMIEGGLTCAVTRGSAFDSTLRCSIASLPQCTPSVDCPKVTLTVMAGSDGAKTNTAEAYSLITPDPDLENNDATVNYTVTPRTDVIVEKTASHSDGESLAAGQPLIYTIAAIVPSNGLSDAENVRIVDSLPAGLLISSVVASQGSCEPVTGIVNDLTTAGSQLICNLNTIENGSRHSVTIVTVPSPSLATITPVTNHVRISTSTEQIDLDNDESEISHLILPPTLDLVLNKNDSVDPLVLDDATVYTLVAYNAGPSEAFEVVITDTLPIAGMRLDAIRPQTAGMTCELASGAALGEIGGEVICSLTHLGVAKTAVVEIEMTGMTRGRYTNNASVTSLERDHDPQENNSVSETTSVYERSDLSLTKVSSATRPALLEPFDWIITVTNSSEEGIGLAEDVVLRDTLPAYMELTGTPTAQAGSCDGLVGGRDVVCILPDMPKGASVTVTVPVRVTEVAQDAQAFSNSAAVETANPDEGDNTATGTVEVLTTGVSGSIWRDFNDNGAKDGTWDLGLAGLTVTLTGTGLEGDEITATARTDAAGNYSFALLPPGSYQVSYALPDGEEYAFGRALPTGAGGGTASGSDTITGVTAAIGSPAPNKDFTIIPQPKIALAKQLTEKTMQSDGSYRLRYRLRIHNQSQEPIRGIELHDFLAAEFGTPVSAASVQPGQYAILSVGVTNSLDPDPTFRGSAEYSRAVSSGTLGPNEFGTVTIFMQVNPALPRVAAELSLENTAEVTAIGT